jgi:imidazolonepropionase
MLLIKNIKKLLQSREKNQLLRKENLSYLPCIENAWLWIEEGKIKDFGEMSTCPKIEIESIDASGKMILPCWVDSHTHLVFAASREEEFKMRIDGKSYQEIAQSGGGILNSAYRLREMSEAELFEKAKRRLIQTIKLGTGTIEIKSGYGLSVASEIKMLRVIQALKKEFDIPIKASFLGAHALPKEFSQDRKGYIELIKKEMIPAIAKENLADYIDVFCEKVAFSAEETREIIQAGKTHGLKAKIHTNQFNSMGGIEVCVEEGAISVDHLEVMTQEEISVLSKSNTIGTLLPSAPFFLNDPYQDARTMIDHGVAVALATDYNPGSSPSPNMNFSIALACIKLKMSPLEAINAATINAAYALELEEEVGSISKGKRANFILTEEIESESFIPYSFGRAPIDKVFINGKEFKE